MTQIRKIIKIAQIVIILLLAAVLCFTEFNAESALLIGFLTGALIGNTAFLIGINIKV